LRTWDRRWIFFFGQQIALLVISWLFLNMVRWFSGRTIHGAKDPLGVVNTFLVLTLWVAISVGTYFFYRATEGRVAPAFGVSLSRRRVVDFLAGTLVGLIVIGIPTMLGLVFGTMSIADSIRKHLSPLGIFLYLGLGIVLLLGNSVSEEITSRAYPMQLFRDKALWVRIIIPSIFFATLHLADESFDLSAFYDRTIVGIVLGIAYAMTENIWLASGLHTGTNAAVVWTNGAWWVGALIKTSGRPLLSDWTINLVWTLVSVLGFVFLLRRRSTSETIQRPHAASEPNTQVEREPPP
jgi:membrane protease YdiL (CAAX protease family)